MKVWRRMAALMVVLAIMVACVPAYAVSTNRQNLLADGGMSHSIFLSDDGEVLVCGSNQEMQLGMPDETELQSPKAVDGLESMVAVAAGYNFPAALKFDGTVYTWGGSVQSKPTQVKGLAGVVAISAGQTDLVALKSDGTVWQWALGGTPAQVKGLSDIAAVDAGGSHFLALTTDGYVYAWGSNWDGQLGTGDTTDSATPKKVDGLFNIVDIAAGHRHSLAVSFDGTIYAWGSNSNGQLGSRSSEDSAVPVEVTTVKNAVQVAAGTDCSMALTKDQKLYTWGYGEYGQLGGGSATISQNTPKPVTLTSNVVPAQINCGVYHSMFLTEQGTLYAWGRNKNYQLGTKKNVNAETPQRVITLKGVDLYQTDNLDSASSWAKGELSELYDTGLVSPLLWGNYQNSITRAEFAHLLVILYRTLHTSSPSVTNNQDKFTDIQDHPLKDDIVRAYNLKFINGTSETTFSPNSSLTRQEAATMLCAFLKAAEKVTIPTQVSSMTYYQDAPQIASWAAPYVAYAYKNDIMQGSGAKTFSPTAKLSREQGLLIIARLADKYDWV